MLNKRKKTYFKLNAQLARLSTNHIYKLLEQTEISRGWGINHLVTLAGKKIFVKRIPITKTEYENQYSTKNHFNLPTYYSYGVGSAGFGSFRELHTHIKTTNWVLNDELENFPLMYHYRIIAKTQKNKPVDLKKHKKYVKFWNSNKNIDRYVLARREAQYEIILFLEYFPYVVREWLPKNIDQFESLNKDLKEITNFLKKKSLIHFDIHLSNLMSDGKKTYLIDYGLCLDKEFELTASEKKFFNKHRNYDYNEFVCCLNPILTKALAQLSKGKQEIIKKELKIKHEAKDSEVLDALLNNIDTLLKISFIKIDKRFMRFLKKNKTKILKMDRFFKGMRASNKKNTPYPF